MGASRRSFMRFRNSTRLMTENFKNTYKILVYSLIVLLVTFAFSAALIWPNFKLITESAQMKKVIEDIKDFFVAIGTADSAFLQGFKERFTGENGSVRALWWLIKDRLPNIIGALIGLGILYFIGRFADTLCYFSIGGILNDKMATYADNSFSDAYIKNLGRASIYSIVYVPITLLCDLVSLGICYLLFFFVMNLANVFAALFLSVTFMMAAHALKLTLTSMWLPAMVVDKQPLKKAMKFRANMSGAQARKIYMTYFASVYLVWVINAVAAVCTFGSSLLITVPASFFFFICMQFVNYYTVKGRKYFITYEKISVNPTWSSNGQFFEKTELELGVPEVLGEKAETEKAEKSEKTEKADAEKETKTEGKAEVKLENKADEKSETIVAEKEEPKEEKAEK